MTDCQAHPYDALAEAVTSLIRHLQVAVSAEAVRQLVTA